MVQSFLWLVVASSSPAWDADPDLDMLPADRQVVERVRHRDGDAVAYRMLVAFVGDRDFAEAQRLADTHVQRYPGTRFHNLAVALSKELPKRTDDFKEFRLPTPDAWAERKKGLSRSEQITYLAERLRLLNGFQESQPGTYSLKATQYAEPCGLAQDAAWGLDKGKTKVINPYEELVGSLEGRVGDDGKRSSGMDLTVADIPLLAPFLREDWHILCVSFGRDFTPERDLGTTRPIFAALINNLAKRDLARKNDLAAMTDTELDEHIATIVRWANDKAARDERPRGGSTRVFLPIASLVAVALVVLVLRIRSRAARHARWDNGNVPAVLRPEAPPRAVS